ncbi:MAG: hypothetical protein IPN76_12515 [Saprospiraceae bacterium]|nr:hypothetical protein [Saprospiraceae bacterium]
MEKQFRTISLLVAGLVVFSFLGFYKTYFHLFPQFLGTKWVVHFHVLTVLCWFAMLMGQAALAAKGRLDLHRKIGKASYLLFPVILSGFVLMADYGQTRHKEPALLGATMFDASLFALFYVLAIWNRKNPTYHSRYMVLTALPFINPGLGRFIGPEVSITVEFLLLVLLLIQAIVKKQVYKPYLAGLCGFIVAMGAVLYVSVINPAILEGLWDRIWR